jgi:solute carrier family 35 protein F5
VPLTKRAFAAPEATEQVLPGSAPTQTLSSVAAPSDKPLFPLYGKEFHGALVAGATDHPYSRSHLRREKRKARQQLAGGGLNSVRDALAEAAEAAGVQVEVVPKSEKKVVAAVDAPQKRKAEPDGKIGEGSARTVTEKSRRKQMWVKENNGGC